MNIDQLKEALDAAPESTPAQLFIESVDTSSWKEFGAFFKLPMNKHLMYEFTATYPAYPEGIRHLLNPCFLSCISEDRDQAIQALRADLLKLRMVVIDLRSEGVPARKLYAAFCFFYAYEKLDRYSDWNPATADETQPFIRPLDQKRLQELGLQHAVREGEVGLRV